MKVLVNADVGEGQASDPELIPLLDQANIACGAHTGDETVMTATIRLAKASEVSVGAHVSYPDRENFGRRSMDISADELTACIHDQITVLYGIAQSHDVVIDYVKPHGALYNDMMRNDATFSTILKTIMEYDSPLKFMLQATNNWAKHREHCEVSNVEPIFEVFADRAYDDDGLLLSRDRDGTCFDHNAAMKQVTSIIMEQRILSCTGQSLTFPMQSLCVHGDNPEAVVLAKDIRNVIDSL